MSDRKFNNKGLPFKMFLWKRVKLCRRGLIQFIGICIILKRFLFELLSLTDQSLCQHAVLLLCQCQDKIQITCRLRKHFHLSLSAFGLKRSALRTHWKANWNGWINYWAEVSLTNLFLLRENSIELFCNWTEPFWLWPWKWAHPHRFFMNIFRSLV